MRTFKLVKEYPTSPSMGETRPLNWFEGKFDPRLEDEHWKEITEYHIEPGAIVKNLTTKKIYQKLCNGNWQCFGYGMKGESIDDIQYSLEDRLILENPDNFLFREKYLFTTEDGVDIYQGEKCFRVYKDTFQSGVFFTHRPLGKSFTLEMNKNMLFFSKEWLAKSYVTSHKPSLSFIDVITAYEGKIDPFPLIEALLNKQ